MSDEFEARLITMARTAEDQRKAAVVAADLGALAALLDDSLVYCHTIGTIDTKQSYLEGINSRLEFKSVERGALACRVFGTTVIMTGMQTNTVRRQGDPDWIVVEAFLTQVWNCAGQDCKLVSFHGTRTPKE